MKFPRTSRIIIVVAWLTAMGVLLRYEAYPEWFTRTIPGYKGLISETLLARESWSRILIGDQPAGYSHTSLGVNDETEENLLEISNRLHLRVGIGGQARRIVSQTDIALDRELRLFSFESRISAGPLTMSVIGRQLDGNRFEVTLDRGRGPSVRTVEIPPDTLLYAPGQELALRNLKPGSSLRLKTLNPLTLQSTDIMIKAEARETITIGSEPVSTTRIVSSWQGISLQSWINDDGLVVRQETPLGWTIEACTSDEALTSVDPDQPAPPLFGEHDGKSPFTLLFGKAFR